MSTKIQALVTQFVAAVEAAVRADAIAAVTGALGGTSFSKAPASLPAKRGPGRPRKNAAAPPAPKAPAASKTAKAKGGRRSSADVAAATAANADKAFDIIKATPGIMTGDARKAAKLDKAPWQAAIKSLLAAKRITAKGDRSTTSYTTR